MDIAPADLLAQAQRALAAWPFIVDVERKYGLGPFTLFAVGSRETNLTDELGDGDHGHSVWQLDDRSHVIPSPFPVSQAADIAGSMLVGLIAYFHGNEDLAFDAYNEGVSGAASWGDYGTTGHDYGPDVLGRRAWLQANLTYPEDDPVPKPNDVTSSLVPPTGHPDAGCGWDVTWAGGVLTKFGGRFYGSYQSLPPQQGSRNFVAITARPDGKAGYVIHGNDGSFYTFGPTGTPVIESTPGGPRVLPCECVTHEDVKHVFDVPVAA